MSQTMPSSDPAIEPTPAAIESGASDAPAEAAAVPAQPKPSYVKLAMRNMVRKRGKSLYHFALTTMGLLALLVGLAYLTR